MEKNKITTYFYDARLEFPNRNIYILGDVFYGEIIEIVDKYRYYFKFKRN